jgi:hypothetical protein
MKNQVAKATYHSSDPSGLTGSDFILNQQSPTSKSPTPLLHPENMVALSLQQRNANVIQQ